MRFWFTIVGVFLAVMGVLLVAPTVALSNYQHLVSVHWWAVGLSLLALGVGWFANIGAFRQNVAIKALSCLGIGALCVAFGLRAYVVHFSLDSQLPQGFIGSPMPIKVTATVKIYEISDSLYDPATGQTFRQKAVLSDIRPSGDSKIHTLPSIPNPFFDEQLYQDQKNFQKNQQIHQKFADELTVILTATPPKNLPKLPKNPTHHLPQNPADPLSVLNDLKAGEQATMTVLLSPLVFDDKVQGFDSYRYYRSRHIGAVARVVSIDSPASTQSLTLWQKLLVGLERGRLVFRNAFLNDVADGTAVYDNRQAGAVVLSLLTGDRALIDSQTKALYQLAGISHLLAISGTHALFLAMAMSGFVLMMIGRFVPTVYRKIPRQTLRFGLLVGIGMAYALFTGFDVPAVRTVLMVCVVGLARLWLLGGSSWRALSITAVILLFFDPLVVWQAGFWLSFVAVGLLMGYDEKIVQSEGLMIANVKSHLIALIKLQAYLFVAMLPISLMLFGKVSWFGVAVNVLAVGLFGLVIVPLNLLAGALYFILPSVSDVIWQGLIGLLASVSSAFGTLATLSVNPYLAMPVGVGVIVLGFLAVACWQGRLLPSRFMVVPLVAMTMMAKPATSPPDTLKMTVWTTGAVGQVLIEKGDERWLLMRANSPRLQSYDKYANEIKTKLDALGVGKLTGIVVQTHDDTLGKVAGQLSLVMPVREFWWAGGAKAYGKLTARPCVADVQIGSVMTAMTGWQQIDNRDLHACAVWVQGDLPLVLTGDEVAKYPTSNVVVNAGQDEKLWQVWALLCRDDKKPVNPVVIGGNGWAF